jgi:hypothetical protein
VTTSTVEPSRTAVRVYFYRAGRLQPVARVVARGGDLAGKALEELAKGPTDTEQRELGLSTSVTGVPAGLAVANGAARIEGSLARAALAQVVYTLTQFPAINAVAVGEMRYTRSNFEEQTPIILVESPLPFERVASPLHATGSANTFEATFQYDLVDSDGKLLKTHFATATSGSGTRGSFDFTVPFGAGHEGLGKLVVYERSAKDGSRIHIVGIPIHLG